LGKGKTSGKGYNIPGRGQRHTFEGLAVQDKFKISRANWDGERNFVVLGEEPVPKV